MPTLPDRGCAGATTQVRPKTQTQARPHSSMCPRQYMSWHTCAWPRAGASKVPPPASPPDGVLIYSSWFMYLVSNVRQQCAWWRSRHVNIRDRQSFRQQKNSPLTCSLLPVLLRSIRSPDCTAAVAPVPTTAAAISNSNICIALKGSNDNYSPCAAME
jgi:hypothetical protein